MRGREKDPGVWFRVVTGLKGPDDEFCILGPLEVSRTWGDAFCLEYLFGAERWAQFRVHTASHSGVRDPESTREKPCLCRWLGEPSQCGAAPGMSLGPNGPSVPLLEAKWLGPESRLPVKGLREQI